MLEVQTAPAAAANDAAPFWGRLKYYFTPVDSRYEDLLKGNIRLNVLRDFAAGLIVAMVAIPLAMGFAMVGVLMAAGSLNIGAIIQAQQGLFGWNWTWLFPLFLVYFISGVAETNRAPFDVASILKRGRDHVARLALVLAVDAGRITVGRSELAAAIEVGGYIEASYRRLLLGRQAERGPARTADVEKIARGLLQKRGAQGQ